VVRLIQRLYFSNSALKSSTCLSKSYIYPCPYTYILEFTCTNMQTHVLECSNLHMMLESTYLNTRIHILEYANLYTSLCKSTRLNLHTRIFNSLCSNMQIYRLARSNLHTRIRLALRLASSLLQLLQAQRLLEFPVKMPTY
jgi:hypothetical protein